MRLRTLGGLALSGVSFSRPKPLLLLTYLAVEGPTDRRYLAELFWPRAARARQSLSVAASQLRRAAPTVLFQTGTWLATEVECDAAGLLTAAGKREWGTVADLYAGPFLSGLDVDDGNVELEEWLFRTRELVAAQALRAHLELAESSLAQGDLRTATRSADKAAALLPEVADIEPRRLARLHAVLIATDDPRAVLLKREAGELGVDLQEETVPPTKAAVTHNLPVPLAAFVGRHAELAELERLLAQGSRLLTITGLGGMGKTRLALELARRLQVDAAFDPIYFVPLGSTTDPSDVVERMAFTAQLPVGHHDPVQVLRSRFGASKALFVLDDCEELTAAAQRLLELLEACPGMTLLATSREPFGLPGEVLFPIAGLPLPASPREALDDGARFGGLELYLLTARRYDPRFRLTKENVQAIVSTCERVAGSPLGITLAASLTRVASPAELAVELSRDLDALVSIPPRPSQRHASLRAVFEGSWGRLDPAERLALAGASVFEGGFTRAAAKEVLGLELSELTTLIDRSLVARTGARYDLHPLVRQYAAEKLLDLPVAERLRTEHARYYARLLAAKRRAYRRAGQRVAFEELDREHPNVRAAWNWAVERVEVELLTTMVTMLADHLWVRNRLQELTTLAERALTRVYPGSLLAGHLSFALGLSLLDAEPEQAISHFERAAALGGRHGDDGLVAYAHYRMGRAASAVGRRSAAAEHYIAALPVLEHHDEGLSYGGCLCNLALVSSDTAERGHLFEQAAAACRRTGNVLDLVNILNNLACHMRDVQGDYGRALRFVREALALEEAQVGRRRQLVKLRDWAAYYCVQLSDFGAAELHLEEAERLRGQRDTWEERAAVDAESHTMRAHYCLALGDYERSLAHARKSAEHGESYPLLFWTAIMRGDTTEATHGLELFRAAVHAAHVDEPAILCNLHLMTSALAAVASGGAPPDAIDELLAASDLIISNHLVPRAFDALVVGHLVAPDLVALDLIDVAASHPAALQLTRQLADQRRRAPAGTGRAWAHPGRTPTHARPLPTRVVIEEVRRLASDLRAQRAWPAQRLAVV